MSTTNIFTRYKQEENHFTNGLMSILKLSRFDNPLLLSTFLQEELKLGSEEQIDTFRVLRDVPGTVDAELRGKAYCVLLETKIVSGTLRDEQIDGHLAVLQDQQERVRRLLLLTPDDSRSNYIQQYLAKDNTLILHLSWKRVYDFLACSIADWPGGVFSELVRQFLKLIRNMVFEQDIAGVILKVNFGVKSEVYADQYLAEMKSEIWNQWDTPRQYKSLDGTGRKLLLYDKTRDGITAEVEIAKVERTDADADYPWTNTFAPGTLQFFEPPICLDRIRSLEGFANFGVHRKDRSPFRNITHEQYRQLTDGQSTVGLVRKIVS